VVELNEGKRDYLDIVEELLRFLPPANSQEVTSTHCVGEVLYEDVVLKENFPKYFVSRFDGYLCKGQPPFKLVKEIYPGDDLIFSIDEGCCIFLATGSFVKEIESNLQFFKIEDVKIDGNLITPLFEEIKNNWIKPGSDFVAGDKIFSSGKKLSYKDKFALELLGIRLVKVFKRLNLSIINTGTELINKGDLSQVVPLSSWIISPIAHFDGFNVIQSGPIADNEILLEEVLRENSNSDIILFIGGTGKGKRDVIRKVLNSKARPIFEKFNTPIGKNSYAYLYDDKIILGFSGIIQASVALYYLILRSLIFKQRGLKFENLVDFCEIQEKPVNGKCNWYLNEKIENGKLILKKCNFLNSEFVAFHLNKELFIQKTDF